MPVTFSDIQEKTLPSGLRIIVREDRAAPVAALNFWVRVGSNNETGDVMGWSHGIEHMLFKGTERRPPGAIAREIMNAGGEVNAGTGYETTNYYIVVPSNQVDTALDIHADVIMNSTFDPGELENERQVLIQENKMYRDRPSGYGITWEELFRLGFTTHRYRNPIGGPDRNLRETPREAILKYRDRYYRASNIVYVVVGDVDAEEMFAKIEKAFDGFDGGPVSHDISPAEPPQTEFRFKEFSGAVNRVYGKIGFHVPEELSPENDVLHVLSHVLGVGRSSRLYRELRERRSLVSSISVMSISGFDPGFLVVDFMAQPDRTVEALEAIFKELGRFRREPVTAAELERTKTMAESDFIFGLETMEEQASILGHYATLGDVHLAGSYPERLAAVTAGQVREAAVRYLGVDRATLILHVPEGPPVIADRADLERRLRDAMGSDGAA